MQTIDQVDHRLKGRSRHDSCSNQRVRQTINRSVSATGDTASHDANGSAVADAVGTARPWRPAPLGTHLRHLRVNPEWVRAPDV